MTYDPNKSSPRPSLLRERASELVRWSIGIGVFLAVSGLILGLWMALQKNKASCPNGKYFPEGTTDFDCYVHPQGAVGSMFVILSLMLGILICLAGVVAVDVVDRDSRPQELSS